MHCELVVPALFATPIEAPLPALELLLARGRAARAEAASPERWLARAFGLGEAPLPAGALTVLATGGEPGPGFWLRADPVHLRLLRDRMALIPSAGFVIERSEAEALVTALNRHFAGELVLDAVQPDRWCVWARGPAAIAAEPPIALAGEDVDANLPRGADAARWNALLNEAQMVLHAHPVNEAREERGAPAVNSVWPWGGGALPRAAAGRWQSVSADDPVALGLARLAGARQRPLPADAGAWLERAPEEGRHLLLLDALRGARALGDAEALALRLRSLEQRWFAPFLAALRSGRVGMVTLHVPDAGHSSETIRGDLRRFWRRARPLASYAG